MTPETCRKKCLPLVMFIFPQLVRLVSDGHVHLHHNWYAWFRMVIFIPPTNGSLGLGWSCSSIHKWFAWFWIVLFVPPQMVRLAWDDRVHSPTNGSLGVGWLCSSLHKWFAWFGMVMFILQQMVRLV